MGNNDELWLLFEVPVMLDFGIAGGRGDGKCTRSAQGTSFNCCDELSPPLSNRFCPLRVLALEEPEARAEDERLVEETVVPSPFWEASSGFLFRFSSRNRFMTRRSGGGGEDASWILGDLLSWTDSGKEKLSTGIASDKRSDNDEFWGGGTLMDEVDATGRVTARLGRCILDEATVRLGTPVTWAFKGRS